MCIYIGQLINFFFDQISYQNQMDLLNAILKLYLMEFNVQIDYISSIDFIISIKNKIFY